MLIFKVFDTDVFVQKKFDCGVDYVPLLQTDGYSFLIHEITNRS